MPKLLNAIGICKILKINAQQVPNVRALKKFFGIYGSI